MTRSEAKSARVGVPCPPTIIAILFALVALASIAYSLKAGEPLRFVDEKKYVQLAQSVVGGRGLSVSGHASAYEPPVWPLLLAAALAIKFPVGMLVVISAALMLLAAAVAGIVGVHLTENRWGWIASLVVLAYPLNLYTGATLYPQALATLIILALWALASRGGDSQRHMTTVQCAAAGALVAALSLAVASLVYTGAVVALWLFWKQKGNRVRFALVAGMFCLLPIAAWTARNEIELGSPVIFSTTSGENLVKGNNPSATADSGVNVEFPPDAQPPAGLTEVQLDSFFRRAALNWITHNPSDAASLYAEKTANYFSPYNQPTTAASGANSFQKVVAYLSFGILALGTITRFLLRTKSSIKSSEKLFLVIFLTNSLFMAVFFTRTRFRQPLDSFLLVETSVALVVIGGMLLRQYRHRRRSDLGRHRVGQLASGS